MKAKESNRACLLCQSPTNMIFQSIILNKYEGEYCFCKRCHFLFMPDPHWLDEAYNSSITAEDTGLLQRNIYLSRIVTILILAFFDKKKRFLDFAGGHGVLTRLMRDQGFDFYWDDPYTKNIFARGFEVDSVPSKSFELITSFESFEHFQDPVQELGKMLRYSKNIFFTTELLPDPIPHPDQWWYYGREHGQHISFYSKKALNDLASSQGLNFYSFKNMHLITEKKINHQLFKIVIKFANKIWYPFLSKHKR